ncbi:MAG: DUF421 domain-containing protein [Bacilli bacterium]|nr:DUF421 domain-containing protein [Bacilli bacterium]
MEIIITIFRTFLFYFLIVFVYRIMGKREVGQLGIIDLIVSVLIAELVAISLEDTTKSVWLVIVPILLLVACQIGMSFLSLKRKSIRNILDGKPSVIINHGKINIREMIKQRYNLEDLLTQLREKSIKSINEIEYAILETSGKLSIFKKETSKKEAYPLPIIIEGKIEYDTLKLLDKDISWLKEHLTVDLNDIFYGFYKNNSIYIIKNSDLERY